jgi:hypothetical protein
MNKRGFLSLALLAASLLFACAKGSSPTVPASYRAEIERWKAKRTERLRRPDGWLTLTGLFWLQEGRNPFGSNPKDPVVLSSKGAPTEAGTLVLERGRVRLEPAAGVDLTADEKPVAGPLDLRSDEQEEPTVVRIGTNLFFIVKRGEKLGVRMKDSEAAPRKNFRGLEYFEIDPSWRVEAKFDPYNPPREVEIPTVLGTVEKDQAPGILSFQLEGKSYRLQPVLERGSDELFIIFADETNGKETYGAGRFLYAPMPKDGRTVIDFNRAYNPPCVFTPYATCPLPPRENHLPVRIRAGEKAYAGHANHPA